MTQETAGAASQAAGRAKGELARARDIRFAPGYALLAGLSPGWVSAILALAGAPVRAAALRLSPLAIGATLRVEDSLQAGHSRFYAEIVRIRSISRTSVVYQSRTVRSMRSSRACVSTEIVTSSGTTPSSMSDRTKAKSVSLADGKPTSISL